MIYNEQRNSKAKKSGSSLINENAKRGPNIKVQGQQIISPNYATREEQDFRSSTDKNKEYQKHLE